MGESMAEKLEYEPPSWSSSKPSARSMRVRTAMAAWSTRQRRRRRSRSRLAGEGLLAHVVVSKYVDHLPLHRLEGIFARERIDLPRTTLCGWIAGVASALTPIGDQLRREIVRATYLQTDDTSVTVLDERGGSYKGRLWTYLDPLGRQVVFDATHTHERDGPERPLAEFCGVLQADAYSGYDAVSRRGRVLQIGCWAPARRRFVEAFMTNGSAAPMMKQYGHCSRDSRVLS